MQPQNPIQRGSWSFEFGQPLFLQENDPDWGLRSIQSPTKTVDDVYLRVDWQTLRRLPKSRAMVFNFRALFTPLRDFRQEPYIPALVLKILRESKSSFMVYKSVGHVAHVMLPALEDWKREQEEKGWVPKGWQERTLNEHPYFPGWGEKLDHWLKAAKGD